MNNKLAQIHVVTVVLTTLMYVQACILVILKHCMTIFLFSILESAKVERP